MPGSVIVNGIPGSGKTTVARALAKRQTLAAHLEQDAIRNLIVAGGIAFGRDTSPEDLWPMDLARKHVCMLATSFAEHGVLSVVDDTVPTRGVFDLYRAGLPTPLRLITLAPSIEVVSGRDAGRDKHFAAEWAHLAEPMTRDLGGVGLWLDTSDLDVEGTVAAIESSWDRALV